MPFFVRPVARALCATVQKKLIDPNIATAMAFIEDHLSNNTWFAGEYPSIADFQMSFAVEALLSRGNDASGFPAISAYADRLHARAAYQRAIAKGGPVVM
jgi:glutathione S-transferase